MKRIFQITLLTFLICVCVLGVAALGTFLYVRFGDAPSKLSEIERRMQNVESRPVWKVRQVWEKISTTDLPENTNSWHELRLVYSTNTVQKFHDIIFKEPGPIVTAWISDWIPRSEMAKFEVLSVSRIHDGGFEISAKASTNASIAMQFKVTCIME